MRLKAPEPLNDRDRPYSSEDKDLNMSLLKHPKWGDWPYDLEPMSVVEKVEPSIVLLALTRYEHFFEPFVWNMEESERVAAETNAGVPKERWISFLIGRRHFDDLKIPDDATQEVIETLAEEFLMTHHPDKLINLPEDERIEREKIFKRDFERWKFMCDPFLRERYVWHRYRGLNGPGLTIYHKYEDSIESIRRRTEEKRKERDSVVRDTRAKVQNLIYPIVLFSTANQYPNALRNIFDTKKGVEETPIKPASPTTEPVRPSPVIVEEDHGFVTPGEAPSFSGGARNPNRSTDRKMAVEAAIHEPPVSEKVDEVSEVPPSKNFDEDAFLLPADSSKKPVVEKNKASPAVKTPRKNEGWFSDFKSSGNTAIAALLLGAVGASGSAYLYNRYEQNKAAEEKAVEEDRTQKLKVESDRLNPLVSVDIRLLRTLDPSLADHSEQEWQNTLRKGDGSKLESVQTEIHKTLIDKLVSLVEDDLKIMKENSYPTKAKQLEERWVTIKTSDNPSDLKAFYDEVEKISKPAKEEKAKKEKTMPLVASNDTPNTTTVPVLSPKTEDTNPNPDKQAPQQATTKVETKAETKKTCEAGMIEKIEGGITECVKPDIVSSNSGSSEVKTTLTHTPDAVSGVVAYKAGEWKELEIPISSCRDVKWNANWGDKEGAIAALVLTCDNKKYENSCTLANQDQKKPKILKKDGVFVIDPYDIAFDKTMSDVCEDTNGKVSFLLKIYSPGNK